MVKEITFYGQFGRRIDKLLYKSYFKDKMNGVALEAGAVDGHTISTTRAFEESLNWKCINIEPLPASFEKLQKNRPHSLNINVALSNKDGEVLFRHGPNHILRAGVVEKESSSRRNKRCRFEYIKVPSKTYRTLIEEHKIEHIDLMVIDVEGHELEVVEGIQGARVLPYVLCIEHEHCGRDNLKDLLIPMGYKLDKIRQANAMFVKNNEKCL